MVRSKITSRNAWRSALTWAVPGVFTTSTSSPSSRNKPSSRATSTAKSWTAFIAETRTGFNSACIVMAPPQLHHPLASKHVALGNHHEPTIGHLETLPVAFEIKTNSLPLWHVYVLIDDGTTDPRMTVDMAVVHDDRPFHK